MLHDLRLIHMIVVALVIIKRCQDCGKKVEGVRNDVVGN